MGDRECCTEVDLVVWVQMMEKDFGFMQEMLWYDAPELIFVGVFRCVAVERRN